MNRRADIRSQKTARIASTAVEARNGALVLRPSPEKNPLPARLLTWWMRLLALSWLVVGMSSWALIVGVDPSARPFESRATTFQAITIFFAIVDVTAAVGLWLLTAWGGVLWLIAAAARLVLAWVLPTIAPIGAAMAASIGLSLAVFGGLLFAVLRQRAARED
jgi:fatty acid desaturase